MTADEGRSRFASGYNYHPNQKESFQVRERTGQVDQELGVANAEQVYRVDPAMLPLHCPIPGTYLWNSHPKVYLPIEQTGEAKCPYCGASYELSTTAS